MTFQRSLKEGGYGEHTVWNLFNKLPKVRSVVDVREDKNFQEQDIDFLVESDKRQFFSVEVKTDFKAHDTGNIVYEVTTSGNIGCFEKTQAKFIAYFIPESEEVHLIDVKRFREYVNRIRPEPRPMGDNATGYVIPIESLKENDVIICTYEGVI